MIRARLSTTSHSRDDALSYLYNKLDTSEWEKWKRTGDIVLTLKRAAASGVQTWTAAATVIRAEDGEEIT